MSVTSTVVSVAVKAAIQVVTKGKLDPRYVAKAAKKVVKARRVAGGRAP